MNTQLTERIAKAVVNRLALEYYTFAHWWQNLAISTQNQAIADIEGTVSLELTGETKPSTARLYQYSHVWYDWNMDSRTTLTSHDCNTLEEAVNQVMLTAIEKHLDPPWWWQKPEEKSCGTKS